MVRQRLPNRRMNRTAELVYGGTRYEVTLGFHPATGKLREVFTHGAKTGSHMDGILDDASILLSLLLQHGVEPVSIIHSLGRVSAEGEPASIIGAVGDLLTKTATTRAESAEDA